MKKQQKSGVKLSAFTLALKPKNQFYDTPSKITNITYRSLLSSQYHNPVSVYSNILPFIPWSFPDMLKEGGIKARERKTNDGVEWAGGGPLHSFCAGEESCSTIPIPQSIIIKTLTSTRGGKRGRGKKKNRGEEKRQR